MKQKKKKVVKKEESFSEKKLFVEAMYQIKELQSRVSILEKQQKIEEPKKEYKRPRAKRHHYYYSIAVGGAVYTQTEEGKEFNDVTYATGNYYLTEEEATHAKDKQLIHMQLVDLALELNAGRKIDWADGEQEKNCISIHNGEFAVLSLRYQKIHNVVYCLSTKFLVEAVKRIGRENLMKLFEE